MRKPVSVKNRFRSVLTLPERPPLPPSFHPHSLDERFSLGASWVFSFQPVLPPDCRPCFPPTAWKVGQAIDAVTGTRRLGFCISFLRMFCLYAAAGIALWLLLRNGSYTSPLTHNRCNKTASFRATAMMARFFPLFPPRSASFSPQRRRSLSAPNGPRMCCAPCTSRVRRYGSPSLSFGGLRPAKPYENYSG